MARRSVHHARSACLVVAVVLAASNAGDAQAFPHVVRRGETLAQIAERTYGRVEMEQLLVAANGLDVGAGLSIVPGMRLEIPAVGHRRVDAGETWGTLALELLGDERRGDALALANNAMPWIAPADGQEIVVPWNLRVVAGSNDSLLTIAYRYLGDRDQAWMLDGYNRRKGEAVKRGDVVLVPIKDLNLTAEGKREAGAAGALVRAEGAGNARDAQRRADSELPQLAAEIRAGRWVDAAARGNRMLGYGELTRPENASIQRALLEAYVALDATGLAETACGAWRTADPSAALDPVELSPKILRACVAAIVGGHDDSAVRAVPLPAVSVPSSVPTSMLPPRDRRRGASPQSPTREAP